MVDYHYTLLVLFLLQGGDILGKSKKQHRTLSKVSLDNFNLLTLNNAWRRQSDAGKTLLLIWGFVLI